jgi:hypothetical protein
MGRTSAALSVVVGQKEGLKNMLHDEVDEWVEALWYLFEQDREPTLEEFSELFTKTRQRFLGVCLQRVIEQRYAAWFGQEFSDCPRCGKRCKKRRLQAKTLSTMHGEFELQRPWFYCADCLLGFCPLDGVLQTSRREHQFDLQQKAVKLSARVPFSEAGEIFKDLTGRSISDHFIHGLFEEVGSEAVLGEVIPSAEEIQARIERCASGAWRPILVVASDGAHLPTRNKAKRKEKRGKGRWQEAKGFRIYLVCEDRIVHLASWHQIQDEEQFGKDLALVASRIPQDQVRVALLGDGAEWLWKHMTRLFPKGRQILDYYHCVEHVHKVARVQYGGKEDVRSLEWVESAICRLYFSEVDNVIAGLRRMKPKNLEAEEEIRKLISYLDHNGDRIHYHRDRCGGYPIGSGGIESANKYICHTRMKRSGAWWVKETGNDMLRIRCAIYNGTYDKVFQKYKNSKLQTR